eukprot:1395179-Amorphochlora_amoeboformis.AAC.1
MGPRDVWTTLVRLGEQASAAESPINNPRASIDGVMLRNPVTDSEESRDPGGSVFFRDPGTPDSGGQGRDNASVM